MNKKLLFFLLITVSFDKNFAMNEPEENSLNQALLGQVTQKLDEFDKYGNKIDPYIVVPVALDIKKSLNRHGLDL